MSKKQNIAVIFFYILFGFFNVIDAQNIEYIEKGCASLPEAPPFCPEEEIFKEGVFFIVEKAAEFPGGKAAMFRWINKNKKYPIEAKEYGIQGKVVIRVVIEIDGSVKDIKVLRGTNDWLDKEATRIVSTMPKWTPAQIKGKEVPSYVSLPIIFRLD